MAVISDMEIFNIHPPLHADPSTPMHDLATWDPERLLRISRWKQSRGQSKDVVRAYAKAILAFNGLHEAAACVQLSPTVAAKKNQNSNRVVRNSKAVGNNIPEPTSSHALAPCRSKAPSQAPKPLVSASWALWPPRDFGFAPPARFYTAVESWLTMLRWFWHIILFALQWTPVVGFVVAVVVVVTDPCLLFSVVWEAMKVVPSAIRSRLAGAPPINFDQSPNLPDFVKRSRVLHNLNVVPPPDFAHPSLVPTPAVSPFQLVVTVLSAQGGGAGLLWIYVNRASLFGAAV